MIGPRSTVCTLIPHYGCESWLGQAIESLLDQTRPPDAIVVIDDASPEPPVDTVAPYPEVTLLAAPDNGGPYRLVQAVIDATDFDAYLFQDADDWSAPDRLEVLLAEAHRSGAELIGSHELRVLVDEGDVHPVRYPLDVNAVLAERPTAFPLLHPTSLVARDLAVRVGGFATGMRFSGDAEFLRRAAHAARVVNVDHVGYFRRKRAGSLTMDAATGLGSPERRRVQEVLAARARRNAEDGAHGRTPDIRPWRTAPRPQLRHVTGPPLGARAVATRPRPAGGKPSGGPVFVIGAPRGGLDLLAWALGQHPALYTATGVRWLAGIATDLARRTADRTSAMPERVLREFGPVLAGAGCPPGRRLVAAGTDVTLACLDLAELLPDARFVHVVREAHEAVGELLARPTDGGVFHTAARAWRSWLHAAQAGLDAERGLGSGRVLRIQHRDLVGNPEPTLGRCLDFLGENWHLACVRPVVGLESADATEAAARHDASAEPATAAAARRLSRVLTGPQEDRSPDAELVRRVTARRRAAVPATAGDDAPASLVERVRQLVVQSVPPGATVVVASRGDDRLLELGDRIGWHVPQVDDGVYAGHHPADSDAAVSQLVELQSKGAEYLAIPASSLWWLAFYDDFRRHLDAGAELVAFHEESGALWRLTAPGTPQQPDADLTVRFVGVPAGVLAAAGGASR